MLNQAVPFRYMREDITLLLTNRCGNRCRHCIPRSGSPLHDELDAEEIVRLLPQIRKRFDAQGLAISGGEPFLKPSFGVVHEAAASMFQVSLFSSGFGLTQDIREVLGRIPPSRFIASVYGLPATHDAFCGRKEAFADVERCLTFFTEIGSTTVVNMICHRENITEIPAVINHIRERGIAREVKVLVFSPVGRGKEMMPLLLGSAEWLSFLERLRNDANAVDPEFAHNIEVERHVASLGGHGKKRPFPCAVEAYKGGTFSSCVHIDADGEIYPCVMLLRHPAFRIGNVRVLERLDLADYRRRVKNAVTAVRGSNCTGCPIARECSKGCLGYHTTLGIDHRCAGRSYDLGCPTRYEALL